MEYNNPVSLEHVCPLSIHPSDVFGQDSGVIYGVMFAKFGTYFLHTMEKKGFMDNFQNVHGQDHVTKFVMCYICVEVCCEYLY